MKGTIALTALAVLLVCAFGTSDRILATPDCIDTGVTVEYSTCKEIDCTSYDNGCSHTTFTPACTAFYEMDAWTTATPPYECAKCRSCLSVYTMSGQRVGHVHTANCGSGQCYMDGTTWQVLTAGATYTVELCLVPCDLAHQTCDACEGVSAHGCLRIPAGTRCRP